MLDSHHDPCFIDEGASKFCFRSAEQIYKCVNKYVDVREGVSTSYSS
jgi:hypothetical protein